MWYKIKLTHKAIQGLYNEAKILWRNILKAFLDYMIAIRVNSTLYDMTIQLSDNLDLHNYYTCINNYYGAEGRGINHI